jgi:hypothetical protein
MRETVDGSGIGASCISVSCTGADAAAAKTAIARKIRHFALLLNERENRSSADEDAVIGDVLSLLRFRDRALIVEV